MAPSTAGSFVKFSIIFILCPRSPSCTFEAHFASQPRCREPCDLARLAMPRAMQTAAARRLTTCVESGRLSPAVDAESHGSSGFRLKSPADCYTSAKEGCPSLLTATTMPTQLVAAPVFQASSSNLRVFPHRLTPQSVAQVKLRSNSMTISSSKAYCHSIRLPSIERTTKVEDITDCKS